MNKILGYFKDYHIAYFDIKTYLQVFLFISALTLFNYKFDFEYRFIDAYYGSFIEIPLIFVYHAIAYFGVLFIIFQNKTNKAKIHYQFWIKSILALIILSIDRSIFPLISKHLQLFVPFECKKFYLNIFYNSYGWFSVVLLAYVVKLIFDKHETYGLYGLRTKDVTLKPYLILLLLAAPLIYLGSQMQDFINFYPIYKRSGGELFAQYYNIHPIISKIVFEFFYIMDFLNTELVFRGLLIIGLSKYLGKDVILPMVACYVVLHFGKPLGETITSAFGGYILGIIALYSRNIWGGVLIHGGIAILMEVFAFMQQ